MTLSSRLPGLAWTTLLFLTQSGCGDSAKNSRLKTTIDPQASDFKIGRGIDIITGKALGDCIFTPETAPAFDTNGKEFTLSISKIESSQDLFRQIGITAKSKYYAGGENASGKISFSDQFSIKQQSLFLSINVRVTNPLYTIADVKMKSEAIEAYKNRGEEGFRETCGDEFVRSFTSGGEFIAILEIHTENSQHKKEIDASLKGSYGSHEGPISFSQNLEDAIANNKTDIFLYQSGGTFEHVNLTADALIRKASSYPATITATNSRPIMAFTAPYKTLLNFPGGPSSLDIYSKEKVLNKLADDDLLMSDRLAGVEYTLNHLSEFPDKDPNQLRGTAASLNATLKIIRKSAKACVNNYKECHLPDYQPPAPASSDEEKVCILWLNSDGAPYLKPKSEDGGSKRSPYKLAQGKTYKYRQLTVHKDYSCKKVENGMQTLNLHLETLGYSSDTIEVGEIKYF